MRKRKLGHLLIASVCFLVAGCGGGSGSGTAGGGPTNGDSGVAPTTTTTPNGLCRFVLVDGTTRTTWEGTARARMNGSGNLEVQCDASDRGPSNLRLGFGNATFDGPRTYQADDFTADGSLAYAAGPSGLSYESGAPGSSCTLVLVEAPVDMSGDSVPVGTRIAGSFTCKVIVGPRKAVPSGYAVEDGTVAAIVQP
jgi:hypothetical protein